MVGDGVGDDFVLFLVERVIAAHHALQLGELADHAGGQIGLGEDRGALGEVWIGADECRDVARQHAHPLHPVILRAELVVEDDLAQLRHAVLEHHLAVLVPEELGVGEPRADHALIAGDDRRAAILGLEIGDHDEAVGEVVAAPEREAFLMRLHRGCEHLGRHVHEALVECAHQHHRPFGEAGILGEQRLVLDQRQAFLGGKGAGIFQDADDALVAVEVDISLAQLRLIIVEALHRERLRRHEAVAARLVAAPDAVDVELNDLAVEQCTRSNAAAAPSASGRCPSAWISARGSCGRSPARARRTISAVGRPGCSISAT